MAAGKPYKVVHHSGATVCVVSYTTPRYFICPILICEQSFSRGISGLVVVKPLSALQAFGHLKEKLHLVSFK